VKGFLSLRSANIEAKASLAYLICNIIQKSITFLTLPLFTRLLTTTQYGQYNIYTSWSAILSIFTTLNLPYGTFGRAMVKFDNDRDGYICAVQTLCTVLSLLFILIYFPFNGYLVKIVKLPMSIILIMVGEILFSTSIQFWFGKNRFEFQYKNVVLVTISMALISPICGLIFVLNSEEKGYARIIGFAVITMMFGLVIYIRNYIHGRIVYKQEYIRYAIGFNVPLIVYYLSQVLFGQCDRLMIDYFCGTDKAGIYGVAQQLALALNFVLTSINGAYTPWMYGKIKEKHYKDNVNISLIIAVLMSSLLLGIIWMAPEIIMILGGIRYIEAIWVVPPIAMSLLLLFYAQLFINLQFYMERKSELIVGSILAAALNVILNQLYIPRFGYFVAGYTTFFSYGIFALCNYYFARKSCTSSPEVMELFNIKALLIILLLFVVFGFLGMILFPYRYIRYAVIIVISLLLFIKRKIIILELRPILKKK